MTIEDDARIRCIRAILGWKAKKFCEAVGISPNTLTNWEQGRSTPTREKRKDLAKLCQQSGIAFLPSGMPCPVSDLVAQTESETA